MLDPRIHLKQPWLAGILAFLMPGAGHLYQGRYFKAAIYFFCIISLFLTGMAMAEWQAVQPPPKNAFKEGKGTSLLKYAAQSGVGLPVLFGLVQRERFHGASNTRVTTIDSSLTAPFQGTASYFDETGNHTGDVQGTLTLEPSVGQFGKNAMTGKFTGKIDGEPITFQLSDHVELAPPIDARKDRPVVAGLVRVKNGQKEEIGHLRGTIPRGFWNWFEVPMDPQEEEGLHRRLGKYHELAMVFTWVAGLLNVLAIWDAVEGPAYGYGDERAGTEPVPPSP
ncbi:DUF6677 family protein [Planctomicrobium sp. SH661]|uniref:DUF6677 family protein n=1 Tax=Planctomicrobium sp. SH661 TaxID=3448124 RepID=UPI003F5CB3EE